MAQAIKEVRCIRLSLLTIAAAVFLFPSAAEADTCTTQFKQNITRDYIRTVFARPHVTNKARKRIEQLIACAHSERAKRNLKRYLRKVRHRREVAQSVTPYQCHGQRWAVPCYIIDCESDFRNLGPNHASAAGYYQFITSTWLSTGGGRYAPAAHLATKAEQDIVAARLWSGGAGAGHWDCA